MGNLIKAKFKAMGVHFCISVVVFLGIVYLIMVQWYPGALTDAGGGWNGLKLMAAVDLVLGPSLTFIIFNNKKSVKEITFDLTIVALIQISALIWGGMQVYSERPVALVMWEGVFYPVTESYYDKQNVSLKDLSIYSDESPLLIYAGTDHSVEQLKEIRRLNNQKIPSYAQVHLYKPVKDSLNMMTPNQLSNIFLMGLGGEYIAERNQLVFAGEAKHKKLLIYLDSEANLDAIKSIQ